MIKDAGELEIVLQPAVDAAASDQDDNWKKDNLYVICTLRSDRVERALLKDLKKQSRVSHHVLRDAQSSINLIRWNDNSQVTLATNLDYDVVQGMTTCKGWSREKRERTSFPMPSLVKEYNKCMCEVDLFNQMRGLYRIRMRKNRWYFPIFRFCLNGAVVNSWPLYKQANKGVPLLEFFEELFLPFFQHLHLKNQEG
ncbi:hypothetical protein R5R35_002173 [Gryllus longicercus]|uniref:PiggyBac transposable element-derived protein domain-containing protein n=1 Tax=Gryllus longicercus TaxID=2509291 RepID=A0AAN9VIL7_9ORTH